MEQCSIIKKESKFVAGGRSVIAKALSIRELIAVKQELSEMLSESIKKFKANGVDSLSPQMILVMIESVPGVLLVLDQSIGAEKGFCEQLSLSDLSEVILKVIEVNDLERAVPNFKKLGQILGRKTLAQKTI